MPPKQVGARIKAGAIKKLKKHEPKELPHGLVFIQAAYNNTIVTLTDQQGNTLSWKSTGGRTFRGSRKSSPFAAQQAAANAANAAREYGLRSVDLRVASPGSGRESAIRALAAAGIDVRSIRDVEPVPFGSDGVRPPKRRRISGDEPKIVVDEANCDPTTVLGKPISGSAKFRQVFLERANRGALEILETLKPKDIASAVAAPTDAGVLIAALERTGGIGALAKDPLAEAKLLGHKRRLEQLELEGGALTSDDVATLLNISRQAVVKKIDAGTLLGIRVGSSFSIPAWQIEDHKPLSGLKEALKELGDVDDWRKLSFFVNGNVRLGGKTPLQELRAGRRDEVIAAARTLLVHGAS